MIKERRAREMKKLLIQPNPHSEKNEYETNCKKSEGL